MTSPGWAAGLAPLATAVATVVLAGAVSGCAGRVGAGAPAEGELQSPSEGSSAGAVVLVATEVDGMEALISGPLEVVDGCLGVSGEVVLFPVGTTVSGEDPLTVDVPGRGSYALGDELELPGGFLAEGAEDRGTALGGAEVPGSCWSGGVFLSH